MAAVMLWLGAEQWHLGMKVGLGLGGGGSNWAACLALSGGLRLAGICSGTPGSLRGTHHPRSGMCLLELARAVSWELSIWAGPGYLKIAPLGNAGGF